MTDCISCATCACVLLYFACVYCVSCALFILLAYFFLRKTLRAFEWNPGCSHVSIAIIHTSVILSVCPHDETETAETKIAKLGTRIVHHDTSPNNEY